MVVIALDWGRARVGVAVSDELGWFAHPVGHWKVSSQDELLQKIESLLAERQGEKIVLGLPKNMDGSEGDSAESVRRLAQKIEDRCPCEVVLWDERLSSWEAQSVLKERGQRVPGSQKGIRDQVAACVILQSYLDAQRKKPSS